MKVDVMIGVHLDGSAGAARDAERRGYGGVWSAEGSHDPFLPLTLAAEHTRHVDLGTAIAVAFARNPLTVAHVSWDLQCFSGGRFILGLGSQVESHITRRFSMPWSHPATRMREFILAIRAIWHAWSTGDRLDFRGDLYRHTLMTPAFTPGPNPCGDPKIFLAAVGRRMTEVAGEVADGLLCHPFSSGAYFTDVTLPTVERGLTKSGRSRRDLQLAPASLLVTGASEEQLDRAAAKVRRQLSFYGSTPAYRLVLEHHGWGDLQPELNTLSKRGMWTEMADLIDDTVLETLAIVAPPDRIAAEVRRRFGDRIERITFHTPYRHDPDTLDAAVSELARAPR